MAEIQLVAETGREAGTRSSKRLRREGKIPGVVYGHGQDPLAVAVDARELRHALNTEAGVNALINLSIDGRTPSRCRGCCSATPCATPSPTSTSRSCGATRSWRRRPFTLVGEAKEVTNNDGVVEQALFALTIHATPSAIPSHIEVDISELTIGDAIRVGDLKLPAGVTTEVDPEEAIVVGQGAQIERARPHPRGRHRGPARARRGRAAEEAEGEGGEALDRGRRRWRRCRRGRRGSRRELSADWLVVGLGNPGVEYVGHPPQRRRRRRLPAGGPPRRAR